MASRADQVLGRTAMALKLASAAQVQEGLRLAAAQEEEGRPTSLDRVLHESGVLCPTGVWRVQAHSRLRVAACSHCRVKLNHFYRQVPVSDVISEF